MRLDSFRLLATHLADVKQEGGTKEETASDKGDMSKTEGNNDDGFAAVQRDR
jgi:hypothetical protein